MPIIMNEVCALMYLTYTKSLSWYMGLHKYETNIL